ncbi:MAG: NUDIX hydrolase [Chlamydiae bacterium]|nr:NUDIX hydrolase [Chlamydiota bacterium]
MSQKRPCAMGIIFSENRKEILLIKRRDVPVWVLPGGGIDFNESEETCVIREVFEESGFKVKIIRKVGEYYPINRLTRITHIFECKIIEGKPTTGKETQEVKFFPLDKLPKEIPPPYDEWISESILNYPYVIKRKLDSVTYVRLLKNFLLHPIMVIRFLLSRVGIYINS